MEQCRNARFKTKGFKCQRQLFIQRVDTKPLPSLKLGREVSDKIFLSYNSTSIARDCGTSFRAK